MEWQPAAPVIRRLTLVAKEANWTRRFEALVDSGADASVVPLEAVRSVLPHSKTRSVTVQCVVTGQKSVETKIWLEYSIGGIQGQGGMYFIAMGKRAIIGRDILNQFRVTLNGALRTSADVPFLIVERHLDDAADAPKPLQTASLNMLIGNPRPQGAVKPDELD